MRALSPIRLGTLALVVGAVACAKNGSRDEVGATRDSSAVTADSATANQNQSGVTDTKTGESTIGPDAEKTRPDQGQPVTSKGDTISNTDSAATPR